MKRAMLAILLCTTVVIVANATNSTMTPAVVTMPQTLSVVVITSGVSYVFGRPPAPPVPPALLAKLIANDTNTIMVALNELDRYDTGTSTVWNALAGLLVHREPDVRVAAIDAIGYLENKEPLVPALAVCMNDRHEDVREAACDALGEIESKRALDILVVNLTNKHEYIRETCGRNLEFHTTESFETPAEWRAWWSSNRAVFSF